MNKELQDKLLELFKSFITDIERRRTGGWKVRSVHGNEKQLSIRCDNGTRNYITDIPTASGVLALWNTQHKESKLKEVEKYCIEDDDRHTVIIWIVEFI